MYHSNEAGEIVLLASVLDACLTLIVVSGV